MRNTLAATLRPRLAAMGSGPTSGSWLRCTSTKQAGEQPATGSSVFTGTADVRTDKPEEQVATDANRCVVFALTQRCQADTRRSTRGPRRIACPIGALPALTRIMAPHWGLPGRHWLSGEDLGTLAEAALEGAVASDPNSLSDGGRAAGGGEDDACHPAGDVGGKGGHVPLLWQGPLALTLCTCSLAALLLCAPIDPSCAAGELLPAGGPRNARLL
jgi:hypothetical protein